MTIRFFILQAHYRSTLDFSNEALQAAEKGLKKLMTGFETLQKIVPSGLPASSSDINIQKLTDNCYEAMNDDFNSPILIANLFEGVRIINSVWDKKETISIKDLELLKNMFRVFIFEILGLKEESSEDRNDVVKGLMDLILEIRKDVREKKDFSTSDKIRTTLQELKINVKDTKEGPVWSIE
jgi:cysteinyl-tRNA synthetase